MEVRTFLITKYQNYDKNVKIYFLHLHVAINLYTK